jgi:hypothetical protein
MHAVRQTGFGAVDPGEVDVSESGGPPLLTQRRPFAALLLLVAVVWGCSIYANLSFAITNKADYRYLPPFKRNVNGNHNGHLGAEYFNIAKALHKGEGFANPFARNTGPTAWMPPVLPGILAGLLWVCDGDRDTVMAIVIFLQVLVLIGTGVLILALAARTTRRVGPLAALAVFVTWMVCDYRMWFQMTHDGWIVLLALDLLLAGLCWGRPLRRWFTAAGWGVLGGLCMLTTPIAALVWGGMTVAVGIRGRAWRRLAVAGLAVAVTLVPWTVRNYLVFGRVIPVKSNLAYELYQSQCLQPDGLLQNATFAGHPYGGQRAEGREYDTLGETAFLDHKREQFIDAVWTNPTEFLDRAADRFLGTTLWYIPTDRNAEAKRPWVLGLTRLAFPVPFLGLLVLLGTSFRERLHWAQWSAVGVYLLYLLPYIGASYYERYGVPLLGVKVLLVIWALDRLLTIRSYFGAFSR